MAPDTTGLKQIRESLGMTQEAVVRRMGGISLRTYIRAENGQKVTNATATQILETINSLLEEADKPLIQLADLGLELY